MSEAFLKMFPLQCLSSWTKQQLSLNLNKKKLFTSKENVRSLFAVQVAILKKLFMFLWPAMALSYHLLYFEKQSNRRTKKSFTQVLLPSTLGGCQPKGWMGQTCMRVETENFWLLYVGNAAHSVLLFEDFIRY